MRLRRIRWKTHDAKARLIAGNKLDRLGATILHVPNDTWVVRWPG